MGSVHSHEHYREYNSSHLYHRMHAHPAVAVRNRWRLLRRGWSLVSGTGSIYFSRHIGLQALAGAAEHQEWRRAGKILATVVDSPSMMMIAFIITLREIM